MTQERIQEIVKSIESCENIENGVHYLIKCDDEAAFHHLSNVLFKAFPDSRFFLTLHNFTFEALDVSKATEIRDLCQSIIDNQNEDTGA